jgi:hypothetical protein
VVGGAPQEGALVNDGSGPLPEDIKQEYLYLSPEEQPAPGEYRGPNNALLRVDNSIHGLGTIEQGTHQGTFLITFHPDQTLTIEKGNPFTQLSKKPQVVAEQTE